MNQITHDFLNDAPREERRAVSLQCEVRVRSGQWNPGRISNLTCEGFQLYTRETLTDGTAIALRFAGLEPMRAQVCWNSRAKTGCRFERPLSIYVFEHLLREYSSPLS